MRKCAYCNKLELCGVGKDNTPVCEEHFNEYLAGKMAIAKKIVQLAKKE